MVSLPTTMPDTEVIALTWHETQFVPHNIWTGRLGKAKGKGLPWQLNGYT
jgi:hypothetical protein